MKGGVEEDVVMTRRISLEELTSGCHADSKLGAKEATAHNQHSLGILQSLVQSQEVWDL
jgi:hypothetical protein